MQLSEEKFNLVIPPMCCMLVFFLHWCPVRRSSFAWQDICFDKREILFCFVLIFFLHCCICEILGAQRTKAKTKKKQWWRPWVDHASSRLTPQPSFVSSSTMIGPCVLDQNAEDSHAVRMTLKAPSRCCVTTSSRPSLSVSI